MEPKDLQNSEELKSPTSEDLKKTEETVVNNGITPQISEKEEEKAATNDPSNTEKPDEVSSLENGKAPEQQQDTIVSEKTEKNESDLKKIQQEDRSAKEKNLQKTGEEAIKNDAPTKKEPVNYSKHSQVELINSLRNILDKEQISGEIKNEVDAIKAAFYRKMKENADSDFKDFIEAGGVEADYKPETNPYEKDIKDLLNRYRKMRVEQNKQLEQEKEENLQKKHSVIEKIKSLINKEESINKTFNEFRDLQQEWREIGLVPQSEMKNLWDLYHFHVENFYDYIKINRELRDLDLKKNLEAKIKLCEKAEELLLDTSTIRAFNNLQKYHEQWRETGPVPHEQKDDIWERFKAATTQINKKHQEYFENRKDEQKKNLETKIALCEKVEQINEKASDSYKEWDKNSKEIIDLQKVWRTIGFAPRKDNNKIYNRFRSACDKFFDAKREFYTKNKEIQQNNLELKVDLCMQAEALKDSTDWKKTTQDFIDIQKKWKEIGPISRKHSESIWKRFRAACDYFFDRKSDHFSGVDSNQIANLKLKEALIEEINTFKSSDDIEENLAKIQEFHRRWSEIGHVPYKKKDTIQVQFREAVNKLYDDLNLDDEKRNMLRFKNKITTFSESSRGQNKMRFEREKYMNKLKQLENDLVLLDNNIGFFAASKNAESLIKDVQTKIEMTKQKIESLKQKIRVIDEIDEE
mgnify:CR=1 FL=1